VIENMSFIAPSSSITGILSSDQAERRYNSNPSLLSDLTEPLLSLFRIDVIMVNLVVMFYSLANHQSPILTVPWRLFLS
jgi:hypothetical protein